MENLATREIKRGESEVGIWKWSECEVSYKEKVHQVVKIQ